MCPGRQGMLWKASVGRVANTPPRHQRALHLSKVLKGKEELVRV